MSLYAVGEPGQTPRIVFAMPLADVQRQLLAGEVAVEHPPLDGSTYTISADGKSLVAIAVPLEAAKAARWAEAKAYRSAISGGGCSTPLGRVQTNTASYQRILGAMAAAQAAQASSAPYSVKWTIADNSIVEHDAAAVIAMGLAVTEFLNACQNVGETIRVQIEAAADAETLAAVDVTDGYPS